VAAQKAALSRREEELEKVFGRGRQVAEALLQEDRRAMLERQRQLECQLGTQFTCFPSTIVQILTQKAPALARRTQEAGAYKAAHTRKRRGREQLHDELVAIMPLIQEGNMLSEELGKCVWFELKIVSQEVVYGRGLFDKKCLEEEEEGEDGGGDGSSSSMSHMTIAVAVRCSRGRSDGGHACERLWSGHKFCERIFAMREYYHKTVSALLVQVQDAEAEEEAEEEAWADPFEDEVEAVILGHAHVYLAPLWWLMPVSKDGSAVMDYSGKTHGKLSVSICWTTKEGEDVWEASGKTAASIKDFVGQVHPTFTCFTSTKVQMLTLTCLAGARPAHRDS
jgi:hypothetical protein